VKELEFEHTVLVKLGLIVGNQAESRPVEVVFRWTARGLGAVSRGMLRDGEAQDVEVITRVTVRAG
jgi:hypothetical protein